MLPQNSIKIQVDASLLIVRINKRNQGVEFLKGSLKKEAPRSQLVPSSEALCDRLKGAIAIRIASGLNVQALRHDPMLCAQRENNLPACMLGCVGWVLGWIGWVRELGPHPTPCPSYDVHVHAQCKGFGSSLK